MYIKLVDGCHPDTRFLTKCQLVGLVVGLILGSLVFFSPLPVVVGIATTILGPLLGMWIFSAARFCRCPEEDED